MKENPLGEGEDDIPWLRNMVDEDLADLFSEDESVVRSAVRRLIEDAREDPDLESRLIDALETSLELSNDDTSASLWATVILGEIRSTRAVDVLLRSLASDDDETLQDAAGVALLRIGALAVEALMEAIDNEANLRLNVPGYAILGGTGILEDEDLRQRVMDFLESRVPAERKDPASREGLESLCRAMAYIGDIRQIGLLRRILAEDFRGRNTGVLDAVELLVENQGGKAIVPSCAPWEDRYGWLFRDERDRARVARPARGDGACLEARALGPVEAPEDELDLEEDEALRGRLSILYWGMSATAPSDDEDDSDEGYDARRFLERPSR